MAAMADLSGITFFVPIAAFLLVFLVSYAILFKSKLIENQWLLIFFSFLVASIFIASVGTTSFVISMVPWVAILLLSLFFILAIVGFVGKDADFMKKGIGYFAMFALGLIFLVSAFFVFSNILVPLLPGPGFGEGVNGNAFVLLSWLYSPRVAGAILLLVISAVVSYVLVKVK
jgi:hypothetical protein